MVEPANNDLPAIQDGSETRCTTKGNVTLSRLCQQLNSSNVTRAFCHFVTGADESPSRQSNKAGKESGSPARQGTEAAKERGAEAADLLLPPEMPIIIDEQAVEDILGVGETPSVVLRQICLLCGR